MKKLFIVSITLASQLINAQVGIHTTEPTQALHIGVLNNGNIGTNTIRIDGLNQTNNPIHKAENQSENLYADKNGVLVINSKNSIIEFFKKTQSNTPPFTPITVDVVTTVPQTITPLYSKTFSNNINALLMYTFQPEIDYTPNLDNPDMFMFGSTRNVGFEIIIEKETSPGNYIQIHSQRKGNPLRNKLGNLDDYATTGYYEAGILKATTNFSDMVPLESGMYRIRINGFAYRSFTDNPSEDQTRNPYKIRYNMANDSVMNFLVVTP